LKVNIVTENSTIASHSFNRPLYKAKKLLRKNQIIIEFFFNDVSSHRIYECDCLFINSKVFRSWWNDDKNGMFKWFSDCRRNVDKVIYFDTTDSSGTLQSQLLPYVDKYMKQFLLKNKEIYTRKLYGGRIFSDYYHKNFGINDNKIISNDLLVPVHATELGKLGVSWNSALSFGTNLQYRAKNLYHSRFTSPSDFRPTDITCRMSINHSRETIKFQRELLAIKLKSIGIDVGRVNSKRYFKELQTSKIAISPFGWGEFAYRDFEIFKSGSLLFKPSMSHLYTWPDLYLQNETYVDFSWDLHDFEMKLDLILSEPEKFIGVATNGQNVYRSCLKDAAINGKFCDRIIRILKD